jgi:excisionase family DNA binding protein
VEKMFLTIKEASELIRISIPNLNRCVRRGEIPPHKVAGRRLFSREELIQWVQAHRPNGTLETENPIRQKRKAIPGSSRNKK